MASGGAGGSGGSVASATSTGGAGCLGIDVGTDPRHCGACDFDCGGGACAAGLCQPIVLAKDQFFADGLWLFGEAIFYRSGSFVRRLPIEGGTPVEVVSTGDPAEGVTAIAAGPESLHWFVMDRDLYAGDHQGAGARLLGSFTGLHLVADMRVAGPSLLFAADGWNEALDPGGQLVRVDGGGTTVLADQQWGTRSLAIWREQIFFANSGIWEQGIAGSIARIVEGRIEALVSSYPADLAVDSDGIYWTEPFEARLMRSGHDGRGVEELWSDEASLPQPLVLHREAVVVADLNGRRLIRVPKGGGAASVVAESLFTTRLASDGHFVFWASRGSPEQSFADGWIGKVAVR
jgi:hypothetical protein